MKNRDIIQSTITKASRDSLAANSGFLLISTLLSSGTGFIFWIIAAKLYDQQMIGIATTIISTVGLVVSLGRLGLDQTMIKYCSGERKSTIFYSIVWVELIITMLMGLFFILNLSWLSPDISVTKGETSIILGILFFSTFIDICANCFIALRDSKLYVVMNLLLSIKCIFLLLLVNFGLSGLLYATLFSQIISSAYCIYTLKQKHINYSAIDFGFIRKAFDFSATNYLSSLLISASMGIMPLIVLKNIGATGAANYYMVSALTNFLFMIPIAFSTSFFAEASNAVSNDNLLIKSLKMNYLVFVPLLITTILFGGFFLNLIGEEYAVDSVDLLRMMALSGIFYPLFRLNLSLKKVAGDNWGLIRDSTIFFLLLIGTNIIFSSQLGLNGIGVSYIISYGVVGIIAAYSINHYFLKNVESLKIKESEG